MGVVVFCLWLLNRNKQGLKRMRFNRTKQCNIVVIIIYFLCLFFCNAGILDCLLRIARGKRASQ